MGTGSLTPLRVSFLLLCSLDNFLYNSQGKKSAVKLAEVNPALFPLAYSQSWLGIIQNRNCLVEQTMS